MNPNDCGDHRCNGAVLRFSILWVSSGMETTSAFLNKPAAQFSEKIDYNYREMDRSGFLWPIVDLRIKYVRPTSFGQKLRVEATIVETANRLKIEYRIYDHVSGETVTKASTVQGRNRSRHR